MIITMRIYWIHDLDLIGICDNPKMNIAKCAKQALIAYAKDRDDYLIHVPDNQDYEIEKLNRKINFQLNPKREDDAKAIELWKKLTRGTKNSALKNMIRMYLDKPVFTPYVASGASAFTVDRSLYSDSLAVDESSIIKPKKKRSALKEKKKELSSNQNSSGTDTAPVKNDPVALSEDKKTEIKQDAGIKELTGSDHTSVVSETATEDENKAPKSSAPSNNEETQNTSQKKSNIFDWVSQTMQEI